MPSGFALEPATTFQVIAAFAAPSTHIESVAVTPGWTVVGELFLPIDCDARLDVIALVSDASLLCRCRLYDRTDNAVVSGSLLQTTSLVGTRVLSGIVHLTGSRNYQIQAECTGQAPDPAYFAVVQTASLSD